jgi:hypothetical protein
VLMLKSNQKYKIKWRLDIVHIDARTHIHTDTHTHIHTHTHTQTHTRVYAHSHTHTHTNTGILAMVILGIGLVFRHRIGWMYALNALFKESHWVQQSVNSFFVIFYIYFSGLPMAFLHASDQENIPGQQLLVRASCVNTVTARARGPPALR